MTGSQYSFSAQCFSGGRRLSVAAMLLSLVLAAFVAPQAAGAATLKAIYAFTGGSDGASPTTGLVTGPEGVLFGATTTTIYKLTQDLGGKWRETPIYAAGVGSLVGTKGALYGAIGDGGKSCGVFGTRGCGAIVEFKPPIAGKTQWTMTTNHNFAGGKDGVAPGGIAVTADGAIYGTTSSGGGSFTCGSWNNIPTGCGTLFTLAKVDGKWKETIVHAFKGGSDGALPLAAPSMDAAGHIYVSTYEGGASPSNGGAASPVSCGGLGAIVRYASLVLDPFGWFMYGATCSIPAFAQSMKSTPLALSSEPATSQSDAPSDSLYLPAPGAEADAVLFTSGGGGISADCPDLENNGCGTVSLLTKPVSGFGLWSLKKIHAFSGPDGAFPNGYLTWDGGDTVYGVAGTDGRKCTNVSYGFGGCGTIFKLVKGSNGWVWGGVVYKFIGGARGTIPISQLTISNGKVLGTTYYGGTIGGPCGNPGCGIVYELTP